ncbi:MAG: hypothetical protein JNJ83_05640 [Verrucomicrobiaceae bacterium]|nr:hypothetical protein [Verrucomicrobiaceae bacterium]
MNTLRFISTVALLALSLIDAVAADTTPPTATITEPSGTITTSFATTVTVRGAAVESDGVLDRVEVRLNGVLLPGVTLGAGTYEVVGTPIGGTNVIEVQAFNVDGLFSTVVRRTFSLVWKKALEARVSPLNTGKVSGVLAGEAYRVGRSYSLTATPAAGFIFDRWSGFGLTAPATEFAKLNFVYTDALAASTLVPQFTANFVPNPFTPAVIGDFSGLILEDGSASPTNANHGAITLRVTNVGSFTGSLKVDGSTLKIAGSFDNTGVAKFGASRSTTLLVPRLNKPAYELALEMDLTGGTNTIEGTLKQRYRSALVSNSNISAERAAGAVNAAYLNRGTSGFYTVALPAAPSQSGLNLADYPQGTGHGTVTINNKGKVTLACTLADGTKLTAVTTMSKDLTASIYAQIYPAKAGCFGGRLTFDDSQANTDVTGPFFWFRPWQNVHHYPWGWPEGIDVDLIGTKYNVTPGTSVLLGLSAGSPNATLRFDKGLLSGLQTKSLTVSTTNGVSGSDGTWSLKITPSSGLISGSFLHTDGTKPKFTGVILQKGSNDRGLGFFLSTKPKLITGLGESGVVILQHN